MSARRAAGSARVKPNKARDREFEEVRESDPDGRIVYHHRTVDTLGKMLRAGTIDQAMHDGAKDFQAAFIIANLDPLRAIPILRVPGTGREPELNERQLAQGAPVRRFADFTWSTLDSWTRTRRVVAKAEHLPKGSNPRFVVTSLSAAEIDARTLYEQVYCARGEVENRMYGRLPPCKRVSSSLRHAWSAAAMYPAC